MLKKSLQFWQTVKVCMDYGYVFAVSDVVCRNIMYARFFKSQEYKTEWLPMKSILFKFMITRAWNSYPNCGQIWMQNKTMSIHVLKLDFIAINVCYWVNCHSLGEKMFQTVTFCKNCFGTRILTPTELGSVGALQHHCSHSYSKIGYVSARGHWTLIMASRHQIPHNYHSGMLMLRVREMRANQMNLRPIFVI